MTKQKIVIPLTLTVTLDEDVAQHHLQLSTLGVDVFNNFAVMLDGSQLTVATQAFSAYTLALNLVRNQFDRNATARAREQDVDSSKSDVCTQADSQDTNSEDGVMYYAVCYANGPISVRLASTEAESIAMFNTVNKCQAINDRRQDAVDDLGVFGADGLTADTFDAVMCHAGGTAVVRLIAVPDDTQRYSQVSWYLWRAVRR